MGLTVTANMMTISHKGSNGVSIAFPDVCKTPTPAGPIPIPYPNVAMSSDTAKGSSTVKMDKKPVMLKGSNMKMSTGDEAGAAQGVVSSKIKFVNYSFDVKADGKNVCRLLDPAQQNMGSANAFGPAHIQAPLPIAIAQWKACEETKEKQKEQESLESAWGESGVVEDHQTAIQKVVDQEQIIIYFRQTNPLCQKWIEAKHKPKPHEVIQAKTISMKNVAVAQKWLNEYFAEKMKSAPQGKFPGALAGGLLIASNAEYSPDAMDYLGVVMSLTPGEKGKPLRGYGEDSRGASYEEKWITGDYDLMDIMGVGDECKRPCQNGPAFAKIKKALNDAMNWDGIQHGPQAQWVATRKKDHVPEGFSMPRMIHGWLNSPPGTPVPGVVIAEGRDPLPVCDNKLTVVAPKGCVIYLESDEDVKNALICCGCGR